jgi:hypothetical protein
VYIENLVALSNLMLLIITAIKGRRQAQLSRVELVPADERKLTLTAANRGLDK